MDCDMPALTVVLNEARVRGEHWEREELHLGRGMAGGSAWCAKKTRPI